MILKISDLPRINAILTKEGCPEFIIFDVSVFAQFLSKLELFDVIDEADYQARYPDIAEALRQGVIKSGRQHYLANGYFEGRTVKIMETTTRQASKSPW